MIKKILCLIILSLLLGCSKTPSTIEQALEQRHIQYDKILKTLDTTNELVILIYTNKDKITNEDKLNIGLLKHKKNDWSWVIGQNSAIDKDADIDWAYTNMDEKNPMFVDNDKIKKIVIQTKKSKKKPRYSNLII